MINVSTQCKSQNQDYVQLSTAIVCKMINVSHVKLGSRSLLIIHARNRIKIVWFIVQMDAKNVLKDIELMIVVSVNMLINIVGISVRKVAVLTAIGYIS